MVCVESRPSGEASNAYLAVQPAAQAQQPAAAKNTTAIQASPESLFVASKIEAAAIPHNKAVTIPHW